MYPWQRLHAQEEHEGIRYLEHCITAGHASDTAIHNYLLSLYVDTNAGDRLERFVNQVQTAIIPPRRRRPKCLSIRGPARSHGASKIGSYIALVSYTPQKDDG